MDIVRQTPNLAMVGQSRFCGLNSQFFIWCSLSTHGFESNLAESLYTVLRSMNISEVEWRIVEDRLQGLSDLLAWQWRLRISAWETNDASVEATCIAAEARTSDYIRELREVLTVTYTIKDRSTVICQSLGIRCHPDCRKHGVAVARKDKARVLHPNRVKGKRALPTPAVKWVPASKPVPAAKPAAFEPVQPIPVVVPVVPGYVPHFIVPVSTPAIRGRGRSRGMVHSSVTRPVRPISPPSASSPIARHWAGRATGATRVWGSRRGIARTTPASAISRRTPELSGEAGQFVPLGGRFLD